MKPAEEKSAFYIAMEQCLGAIEGSKKRVSPTDGKALWDSVPVFKALEIVLNQVYLQRDAVHAGVMLVALLEDKSVDPKIIPKAVRTFKDAAVRSRAHQSLPRLRDTGIGSGQPGKA